jgi:hypothetical protein
MKNNKEKIRYQIYEQVWNQIDAQNAQNWFQSRIQVRIQLLDHVRAQVDDQVYNQVTDHVAGLIKDQMDGK